LTHVAAPADVEQFYAMLGAVLLLRRQGSTIGISIFVVYMLVKKLDTMHMN
jgi:hypothetical protein